MKMLSSTYRMRLTTKTGRLERMEAWNQYDGHLRFYVDNISAYAVNRKALESALHAFEVNHGFAGLNVWEYLDRMFPDWWIDVYPKNKGFDGPIWSNRVQEKI